MKKSYALAVITILLGSAVSVCLAGPDSATMEAKEKAAWQSFKNKDEAGFKKVVDKDIRCVYDNGIMMMKDELDSMKDADIKSFDISDYKIFSDEKDIVVSTYTVKIEGTQGGKDVSGTYNSGSVWKEEGGKWLAIFHTQSKQGAAAATTPAQ